MPDQVPQNHEPAREVSHSQQIPDAEDERNAPLEPSFYVRYRPRILVVDDAPLLRKQLLVALTHAGFDVEAAVDGAEALAAAYAHPPDLILLDVMMPGMDGFEVQQRIREDPRTRDVSIIFLSALRHGDPEALRTAMQYGFCEFVVKPKPPRYIIEKIRACLLQHDASVAAAGGAPGAALRVLVVEGVDWMRHHLAVGLRSAGFDVEEAGDETQALAAARARRPDLILMDVATPEIDGLAVWQRLQEDRQRGVIPIVLLVGQDDPAGAALAARTGVQGCIVAPTTLGRLVEALERAVAAARRSRTDRVR